MLPLLWAFSKNLNHMNKSYTLWIAKIQANVETARLLMYFNSFNEKVLMKCDLCAYTTNVKRNCKRNVVGHDKKFHCCNVCHKNLRQNSDLVCNSKSNTEPDSKPVPNFMCNDCGIHFIIKKGLETWKTQDNIHNLPVGKLVKLQFDQWENLYSQHEN